MRKIKCSMIMIKTISDQLIWILLQKALFSYGTVTIFCSANVLCVRSKFAKVWDLFCKCSVKTTCPVCLLKLPRVILTCRIAYATIKYVCILFYIF